MRPALLALALALLTLPLWGLLARAEGGATGLPALVTWRAREGEFAGWAMQGLEVDEAGALRLPAGGAGLRVGEALSPVVALGPFQEAIGSWNALTPPGTWLDVMVRVRKGGAWSEWFYLGTWAEQTDGPVRRQSYEGQGNAWLSIQVDTLVMRSGQGAADEAQLLLRLLSPQADATPTVSAVGLALSNHPPSTPTLSSDDPALPNRALPVPPCSQMVYGSEGGEIWCSPTSTAMVLGYWAQQAGGDPAACPPGVRAAVAGVYDFVYEGHGNWPFNVAYAATQGLEGYVVRFASLREAEPWLARGVPLVVSFGWNIGELDGAPLPSSAGHLAVLTGLDGAGNPLIHDPAFASDGEVPTVYERAQWERLWLTRTGGTSYLLAPPHLFDPLAYSLFLPMAGAP